MEFVEGYDDLEEGDEAGYTDSEEGALRGPTPLPSTPLRPRTLTVNAPFSLGFAPLQALPVPISAGARAMATRDNSVL
eukprot:3823029-Pyramimonas_sp.AAC.1